MITRLRWCLQNDRFLSIPQILNKAGKVFGDSQKYSTKLYCMCPMKKPNNTSVTLCLPSMILDKLTTIAQSITRILTGTARTRWLSIKRDTMAARVAWPDGKEYLSTENVANMSMRLWIGLRRFTIPFTIPTRTISKSSAAEKKNWHVNNVLDFKGFYIWN